MSTVTLMKPAKTFEVGPHTPLFNLIVLDDLGFRPPFREIESHANCAKSELPDHECHGPHSVCPSCDLEFCSEEYADQDQNLCDLCTDCWAQYIALFEWYHYPNNR